MATILKKVQGRKFLIPWSAFFEKHFLISGISGSGKSTLVKVLFCGLTKKGIRVILLDEQNEAAELVKILGIENVSIVNPYDLKIPLFQCPPNCDYERFYGRIKGIFRECFFTRDRTQNQMDELRDYLAMKGNKYPTVSDFFSLIKNWKTTPMSRKRESIETLDNRFRTLVNSPFDGRECHRLENTANGSWIFMTGMITDSILRSFFLNYLLVWIRSYREGNPHEKQPTVVILEEAHRYFHQKAGDRADLGEPFMIQNVRECRKSNISLVIIDQNPDRLSSQIPANVSNWAAFCLPDPRDVRAMGFSMGLSEQQMEKLPTLKQKEAAVKISGSSQAYLVEIKHFESVDVTEEELKEFCRKSLGKLKPYRVLPGPIKTYAHDPRKSTPILSTYKDIVDYIEKNPGANRSMMKNDLGFSQWELTKHTDAMMRRGYIKEYVISLGKKGSPSTYFEVLKPGFDYLCQPYRPLPGKGDFPHRLIQYLVAKQVKGIVELRGVDVGWEKPNGEKIAIEIEMECNDHVLTNIRRDLIESGFSRVWVLCKNEKLREEIGYLLKTKLEPELLEKTSVKLLREIV